MKDWVWIRSKERLGSFVAFGCCCFDVWLLCCVLLFFVALLNFVCCPWPFRSLIEKKNIYYIKSTLFKWGRAHAILLRRDPDLDPLVRAIL